LCAAAGGIVSMCITPNVGCSRIIRGVVLVVGAKVLAGTQLGGTQLVGAKWAHGGAHCITQLTLPGTASVTGPYAVS
jgi:hypothetical protein